MPLAAPDAAGLRRAGAGSCSTRREQIEAQASADRAAAVRHEDDAARERDADDPRRAATLARLGRARASVAPCSRSSPPASLPRPLRGGRRARDRRRVRRSCRSTTGSSTAAGAASRTGSRGATASSASAPRTRRATAPGRAAALPGRRQRDGAALPLRPLRLRLEGRRARRQPLRDVVEGTRTCRELGRLTLWEGAQPIASATCSRASGPGIDSPRSCGKGVSTNGGEHDAYEPIPAFDAVSCAASDRGGRRVSGGQHATHEGQAREGDGKRAPPIDLATYNGLALDRAAHGAPLATYAAVWPATARPRRRRPARPAQREIRAQPRVRRPAAELQHAFAQRLARTVRGRECAAHVSGRPERARREDEPWTGRDRTQDEWRSGGHAGHRRTT